MDRREALMIATWLLSGRLSRAGSVNPEMDARWAFDAADAVLAEWNRRYPVKDEDGV